METLLTALPWIQISLAVILTLAILLQQRGAGIGGAFGGSDSGIHYERRGSERTLFRATVTLATLFVLSVFVQLIITQSTTPDYIPPQEDITVETEAIETEDTESISTENISSSELDMLLNEGASNNGAE